MDEAPLLNETGVRDLLELVASDEPPPSSVNIARARAVGRRRRRLVRVYLPGAAAPVAAAVAVALIAGLTAHLSGTAAAVRHRPVSTGQEQQLSVPTAFSALTPYASFGWLPDGYSAAGLSNQATVSSSQLTLSASAAAGRMLTLRLYPRNYCIITGPANLKGVADGKFAGTTRHFAHGLLCSGGAQSPASGGGIPLIAAAVHVDGAVAYWTVGSALIFRYGRDAWALLHAAVIPSRQQILSHHAKLAGHPVLGAPPSATATMLEKVASGLRLGQRAAVRYGFSIAGLPGAWQAARPGGSDDVAKLDGKLVNVGWQAGPADDTTALSISAVPAAIPGATSSCNYVDGQSWYVTLDGSRVMLRTIDQPYKHWEELCAPDVRGMSVYITLDTNIPGTNDRPLPGGRIVGGVEKIFRHLQLLGPDVANWTIQQPA
jgi:hypothetical protein